MTRSGVRSFAAIVLAGLVLHLVLVQPNHPAAMTWAALLVLPLELPVLIAGLVALPPGRLAQGVRGVLVAALTLIAILKTADYAMFTALGRGFNPVADLPLVVASLRLLDGTIGPLWTLAAAIGALGLVAGLVAALWWATGVWLRLVAPRPVALASGGAAILASGVAVAEIGNAMGRWTVDAPIPGAAFTARVGLERVDMTLETVAELRTFGEAAAKDPLAYSGGLLDLIDRDVLIVFVESYGRTSFDTPFFAERHLATLERSVDRLEARGLAMRSGFVAAPTRGGQSWLSHATFANGLWIDNQTRYGAALASDRATLFHIAQDAGFRTAAVMPAITLEWPESAFMGFDTVLAAKDLGYRGAPFNWVTMPDQFTLAALDRQLRDGTESKRPLFAQVALVSSHAPWVPVPSLIAWEAIGDGRVFNAMARSGDPPEVVWRDNDRVRLQYRAAVDYALQTVFDYAARHADDPPLLFVIGDHQTAGFVALDTRPDVPVHVIGPDHLVAKIASWDWSDGLRPAGDVATVPMDWLRDMILRSFSSGLAGGGGS